MERPCIALIMEYSINQKGGTEVLVRELAQTLSDRYKIVLVTPDQDLNSGNFSFIDSHVKLPLPHSGATGDLLALELQKRKVDLAHFHIGGTYVWRTRNYFGCPIVRLRKFKIPYLITNHGVFGFYGYCGAHQPLLFRWAVLPYFWISRLLLILLGKAEIMVSKNDLGKMRSWFFPARGKLGFIYHSLLPEVTPATPVPRQKHFVCVGTIGTRKGQWLLTEAFARIHLKVPDWRLVLVGRFSDEETKEKVLNPLQDPAVESKVDFLTGLTDEDVKQIYKTSEIFVMPSLEEGLGLTLQEALFYGCACISSRAGGTEDLIDHRENGLLVKRNNVEELAEAMELLASDEELRESLSVAGPQSIERRKMNSPAMAESYSSLYKEILNRV